MSRNNNNSLSNGAQLSYIVEWFREWSELQREDFLPILAEKITANGVYINGMYNSMKNINLDRPMSLFQCRIKLFNEWYSSWSEDDRDKLVKLLNEVDDTFADKLRDELAGDKKADDDFMLMVDEVEPAPNSIIITAAPAEIQEEEEEEVVPDDLITVPENADFPADLAVEVS